MNKTVTCIVCPRGCRIVCTESNDGIVCTGNACKRGAAYAQSELTHPMRTLTTTVRTAFAQAPALSVRTSVEIPKSRLFDVQRALAAVVVDVPMRIGDVVVSNVLALGCDVIATAALPSAGV